MGDSHVEAEVQRRIAAAKREAEQRKQQRAELAAARRRGLAFRQAARLRNLAAAAFDNTTPAASGC
ncbi:hypothetical protein [Streptomyces sp. DI166]|uniref:hypothetical protein n=1 Tax=Streptomyces sp. DI166 TaxID=1839783 RepID=UPI001146FEFF|nr:hypothetical protein [Streptomyces sp. DI166]